MADKKSNSFLIIVVVLFLIFGAIKSYALFVGDGNPVITGANTGDVIGQYRTINLTGNPVTLAGGKSGTTLTGVSLYGTNFRGNSASEVTVMVTSAVVGMSTFGHIDRQTSISGATLNVLFEEGDLIRSVNPIIAGTSKFILSGTTNAQRLILFASATSEWTIIEAGAPTIDWD